MSSSWYAIGICLAALAAGTAVAVTPDAGPAARGEQLAAVCAGCHAPGTAAESVTESFPNIWGQEEEALRQRLLGYQQDQGAPTLMNRIAKGYTTEELTLIAAAIAAAAQEAQP